MTRQLVNLAIEIADLAARWPCAPRAAVLTAATSSGRPFDQLLGSHGEDVELSAADDETKVFEEATDLVLEIDA